MEVEAHLAVYCIPATNMILADENCLMAIFSTGDSDFGYWYRMWEVTVAIFCMCVRAGKGGSVRGLGE